MEEIFRNMVNQKVKELTQNEDIQELFYSHFTSKNFSKIPKKSLLECVILEPRIDRNLGNVLRNFTSIIPYASFTIFHSNENKKYLENIIGKNHNFNLRLLPDNFNKHVYSKVLASQEFWAQLHGEKILIFQTDTGIRRNDILNFWNFSYIGSPWDWIVEGDSNLKIGNGGLSLRDKKTMIDICSKHKIENNLPEDVFFAKHLLYGSDANAKSNITLPTFQTAYKFAIEFKSRTVSNVDYDSMGFHQILDKWDREFLKNYFSKFDIENDTKITIESVFVDGIQNAKLLNWLRIGLGPQGLRIKKNTVIPFLESLENSGWWQWLKPWSHPQHQHNNTLNIRWKKSRKQFKLIIPICNNTILDDIVLL
jgi:hypothetical protein